MKKAKWIRLTLVLVLLLGVFFACGNGDLEGGSKDYTKAQMLTWYNKLHTDSAEYKLWGNGIAFPCALYVMQGIADGVSS